MQKTCINKVNKPISNIAIVLDFSKKLPWNHMASKGNHTCSQNSNLFLQTDPLLYTCLEYS